MPTSPDALVRQEALDVSRSFLVQAPAGSGKTGLLIQRYLALLAQVAEPESVVAITFTRKAAGEMRDRVLKALNEAASGVPVKAEHEQVTRQFALAVLERDRQRSWDLQRMPARMRIQTIDSLCASIAHSMPAVSGFGGIPEVTDSPEELYAAAAHATVLLLGSEQPELSDAVATLLKHLDNDVSNVEKMIADMLQKRDQWLRHLGMGADLSAVRRSLDDTLESIVCRCLKRLRGAVPREHVSEIVELAAFGAAQEVNATRSMRHCLSLSDLPGYSPADVDAWLGIAELLLVKGRTEWRKPRGIDKRMGFDSGLPQRARLQQLVEDLAPCDPLLRALDELRNLPPARIEDRQWPVIAALFRLLPRAVGELRWAFGLHGKVDFSQVAQAASYALGTPDAPTDLALALGCRIEHLLVDEYQDTSVTQQDLLEKLTATWEPGDGRTVFLVGDPMQSIYRFRQAEVGIFIEAAATEQLGNVHLHFRKLTRNFRSQQGVVDWVNATFAEVFPPENDIGSSAVAYSPAESVSPQDALEAVQVHAFIGDDHQDAEAERVISLIETARGCDPNQKIAVLVRARTHLAKLVPKLRDRGLHFRAVEIDSLAERQIVVDLLSLTRALTHLGDRIAWLSLLRAPWCGLALQDLYTLCSGDSSSCTWDLLRERASQLTEDGQARLGRVREVLEQALASRGRHSLAQSVRGVWLALGGPACVSDGEMDDAATFFDLLGELETAGELPNWQQVNVRVNRLFAHPDLEADGTLQLMTIHKAKGLEFDTVIVPSLGRRGRGDDAQLLLWMERKGSGHTPELLLAPIRKKGGDDDPLYAFIRRIERGRACEEEKRLLYVAATRACTQLHLLGHAEPNSKGELKPAAGSLLQYLWPLVQGEFEAEFVRLQAEPEKLAIAASAEPESADVLKRLRSGWSTPPCPPMLEGERLPAAGEQITFDWAGDTARHIGTVTHLLLHRIAREGLEHWNESTVSLHRLAITTALRECGVIAAEVERAVARVEEALRQTLLDERGRWLLGNHQEAQCEFPVTGVIDGQVRHFKIDRTFVDADGVRWIVDYKTGQREGAGREQFPDLELERYRGQLENYARVLSAMDQRPVRAGLYFPLLGAWRELKMKATAS